MGFGVMALYDYILIDISLLSDIQFTNKAQL